MTAPQDALDSIAERARRALRDNDEARIQAQVMAAEPVHPPPAPQAPTPGWQNTANLVERRMHAIRLVRDLEPQRICFRQRVQELSQRLGHTPPESVHYAHLLQRLAEAHTELHRLEGQLEGAQHTIRTTEWLMDMLNDPTRVWGQVSDDAVR